MGRAAILLSHLLRLTPSISKKACTYMSKIEVVDVTSQAVEEVKPVENNEAVDEVKPVENTEVVEE